MIQSKLQPHTGGSYRVVPGKGMGTVELEIGRARTNVAAVEKRKKATMKGPRGCGGGERRKTVTLRQTTQSPSLATSLWKGKGTERNTQWKKGNGSGSERQKFSSLVDEREWGARQGEGGIGVGSAGSGGRPCPRETQKERWKRRGKEEKKKRCDENKRSEK